MSFLNAIFLFGLPLAALPVIIHLFNRRRRNVVRWGAMRFLMQAATRRRRIWRLSDLLLMLLRLAAILAIVMALAQPMVVSSWLGAGGPRDVIVVIDASMSTDRLVDSQSLFDRQREQAKRLIDDLGEEDMLRVMLASSAPEWITPTARPATTKNKREAAGLLNAAEPSEAGVDVYQCLIQAAETEPANKRATRVIVLITDGHAHGWRAETPGLWKGLQGKINASAMPLRVNVINVGDPERGATNLAVQSIEASRALLSPGEPVVLRATIENTGDEASKATLLEWEIAEGSLGVTSLAPLQPGEQTPAELDHRFAEPGVYEITCRIEGGDDLALDDGGRLVVEVVGRVPVLVVDGSPDSEWSQSESGYLLAALGRLPERAEGPWRSVFEPKVVDANALENEVLGDYHAVVLADAADLPRAQLEGLSRYVRDGGGLWVALGERTEWEEFNRSFYGQGRGLSPVPLQSPLGDADDRERFITIQPPLAHHPATRLLGDTERLDLDRVQIYRRHRFDMGRAGEDVSVLLSAMEGDALVIEQGLGRGRVVIQTVPLSPAWSNLPICQSYVVMAREWLWRLAEPSMTRWNPRLGEPFEVALGERDLREEAAVITPREREIELVAGERAGRMVFHFARTIWPGPYRLVVSDREGVTQSLPFQVWRDVEESNLEPLTGEMMETIANEAGLRFVDDPLATGPVKKPLPRSEPLWGWLLLGLLGLLLVESVFAGLLTRRRMDRTRGLSLETNS